MLYEVITNTYQPSIREIGERFGIKSTKTVSEHLQALADKGFLERDPSRSRGVKILGMDLGADTVSVPCFRITSYNVCYTKLLRSADNRLCGCDTDDLDASLPCHIAPAPWG